MSLADIKSELISQYITSNSPKIVLVIATAIILFEYVLTFGEEVRCVWLRPRSGATYLFLINRYMMIANRLLRLIQLVSWHGHTEIQADGMCSTVWTLAQAARLMMFTVVAAFGALRMYALWHRSKVLGVSIFFLGMATPCLRFYDALQQRLQAFPSPFTGCASTPVGLSPSTALEIFVAECLFTLTFEAVILGLTFAQTVCVRRRFLREFSINTSTSDILMRDGMLYFCALMILTVLGLLGTQITPLSGITEATDTAISIAMSRFILNLRQNYLLRTGCLNSSLPHLSSVQLISIVGNLGAPIGGEPDCWEGDGGDEAEQEQFTVTDDPFMTGLLIRA